MKVGFWRLHLVYVDDFLRGHVENRIGTFRGLYYVKYRLKYSPMQDSGGNG